MAEKKPEQYGVAPMVIVEIDMSKSVPYPRGRGYTMQQLEDARARRWRLAVAGMVLAALGLGIVIGRFLLP